MLKLLSVRREIGPPTPHVAIGFSCADNVIPLTLLYTIASLQPPSPPLDQFVPALARSSCSLRKLEMNVEDAERTPYSKWPQPTVLLKVHVYPVLYASRPTSRNVRRSHVRLARWTRMYNMQGAHLSSRFVCLCKHRCLQAQNPRPIPTMSSVPSTGTIRSAFLMTEPEVASSDATNIACAVRKERGEYVINGRKWWSSGAMDPRCKVPVIAVRITSSRFLPVVRREHEGLE